MSSAKEGEINMATINSFSVVANTYVKQPVQSPSVPISTYAKDCEEFHLVIIEDTPVYNEN